MERDQQVMRRMAALSGIDQELNRGRAVVAEADALVRVGVEHDASVLTAWDAARRVQALPGGAPSVTEALDLKCAP